MSLSFATLSADTVPEPDRRAVRTGQFGAALTLSARAELTARCRPRLALLLELGLLRDHPHRRAGPSARRVARADQPRPRSPAARSSRLRPVDRWGGGGCLHDDRDAGASVPPASRSPSRSSA